MSDFYAGDVIKTRLGAVAAVTSLLGVFDAIYLGKLPQNPVYPCIAFGQNSSRRLQGPHSDPGYAMIVVQVDCLAATLDAAFTLDKQVRLALERFGSDQPAGIPFAGGTLYDIKPGSTASGYTEIVDKNFVTSDYTVCHLETTP